MPRAFSSDEARERWLDGCRRGGATRAQSLTSEHQRAARAKVKRESLITAGARGAAVTLERYGAEFRAECLAEHRRLHPSNLELIVLRWLVELRAPFKRDAPIDGGRFYADFIVGKTALEVDGRHWHTNNEHHGEDREARDHEKDKALRAAGYSVVRLDEKDVLDGSSRAAVEDIVFAEDMPF
jgi:very-short-patch-repair endonuclease